MVEDFWCCDTIKTKHVLTQRGLVAAFDLAASEGYMIARVKKSVNHSGIVQSITKGTFV